MRTYRENNRLVKRICVCALVSSLISLCAPNGLLAEETHGNCPLPAEDIRAFMLFTFLMLAPVIFTIAGMGLHLYSKAMFPRLTANVAFALRENPWKSFFLGLANVPFLMVCSAALAEAAPPLVFIPLIVLFLFLLLGLIGKSENLGRRISSAVGVHHSPIASIFAAWPVLAILIIIPIIGWVILAYMLISGTGGVILSLFRFRRDIPVTESVLADGE